MITIRKAKEQSRSRDQQPTTARHHNPPIFRIASARRDSLLVISLDYVIIITTAVVSHRGFNGLANVPSRPPRCSQRS